MTSEKLKENLSFTQNGIEYIFLAGTEIEYYDNGTVRSGVLAIDVLTRSEGRPIKVFAGNRVDFDIHGNVVNSDLIKIEIRDEIVILRVDSSVEINASIKLEETILQHIDLGYRYFVIDMVNCRYISSSGIRVFLASLRQIKEIKGRLTLCHLSPEVIRILHTVDLNHIFETYNSREDAIADIQREWN